MNNRFADAQDITAVVFQAIGAGSTCWVGGTGDLEFDSIEAKICGDHAVARINEIIHRRMVKALQSAWTEPL